LYLLLFFQLSS